MDLLSRRRFIETGASAAASLAGSRFLKTSRLDELRAVVKGKVIVPSDPAYALRSKVWNARFANVLPAAIVAVADAKDVARTIQFAREHDVSFAVRNGRHSFAGFSANTGLVIDVSALTTVHVDRARERATFGAGQTTLPLYTALWPARMTLPAGTCPTVGISGVSQAGGFGRLTRLHGLTCDNILELKLVTAGGELLTANAEQNPDLFWACRGGGGGNFGAIVELTGRLYPVDNLFTETVFTFPASGAARVMMAVQQFVAALDDRGHIWAEIDTRAPKDGAALVVEFTYAGPERRARAFGEELVSASGVKPEKTTLTTSEWLPNMRDWICAGLRPEECGYAEVSPGAIPRPSLYVKSNMMRKLWPMEAFEVAVEAIQRRQADRIMTPPDFHGAVNVGKILFESAGGALARSSSDTSAFAHRDTHYVMQFQSRWRPGASEAVAKENIAWTQSAYESARPWLSGSAYQGYADPDLTDALQQYYGDNLARLRAIKRKYDPENVFRYAQSIPPA